MNDETATATEQSTETKVGALQKVLDYVIDIDSNVIRGYVETMKGQHPGLSKDELAQKIVSKAAMKNGLLGAVTGVGGVLTLPVMVPADVAGSWRTQAAMVFAVAHVYGYASDTADLRTDFYIILAGDSAKEALKRIGIELGRAITKRAVQRLVTREAMKKVWSIAGRQIVTKAGTKSLTSVVKWVPLVGVPIGFAFNWAATKGMGHIAISYYGGEGQS
jgi:hypothetical protein